MINTHWAGVNGVTVASARAASDMTIPMRKTWNSVNDRLAKSLTGPIETFLQILVRAGCVDPFDRRAGRETLRRGATTGNHEIAQHVDHVLGKSLGPGSPCRVIELSIVAKIEHPAAHQAIFWPPRK